MNHLTAKFLVLTLFSICSCKSTNSAIKSGSTGAVDQNQRLDSVIQKAVSNIMSIKKEYKHEAEYEKDVLKTKESIREFEESKLEYWSLRPYLGTVYLGQFYLLQKWLGRSISPMDPNRYAEILINSQLKNGGWTAVADSSITEGSNQETNFSIGELDTSVFNFWVLRAMVMHKELNEKNTIAVNRFPGVLSKARKFIIGRQIDQDFATITKIFFAMFRLYSWEDVIPRSKLQKALGIASIPIWFVNDELSFLGLGNESFGQWVPAILKPLAYAAYIRMGRDMGPGYNLLNDGIIKRTSKVIQRVVPANKLAKDKEAIQKLVRLMRSGISEKGSYGGYTLHTHFTVSVLDDYGKRLLGCNQKFDNTENCRALKESMNKSLWFVKTLYFDSDHKDTVAGRDSAVDPRITSSYQGVTCDGAFWDTALLGQALLKAGVSAQTLKPVLDFAVAQQRKSRPYKGHRGYPFGWDFWDYPDNDDTAEYLLFLHEAYKDKAIERPEVQDALAYITEMQNSSGGWGAFAHENEGSMIIDQFAGALKDSADLFDGASVDVTGHVLEALGSLGFSNEQNGKSGDMVRNAVKYLNENQKNVSIKMDSGRRKDIKGPWYGRWGVNYIYGTHAAVNGIANVMKDPLKEKSIRDAVIWLRAVQNPDGGFGESSKSYKSQDWAGKGASTPTQTAWGLSALSAANQAHCMPAKMAANFLIKEMEEKGYWQDFSSVGTGHPGIVYMQYPSYAYAFPLLALSQFKNATRDSPTTNPSCL